jgi:hypothetical protein
MESNLNLQFGTHKNKSIIDVYNTNPNYCVWLLKQQKILEKYLDIKQFLEDKLIDKNDYYMTFGKYRNKPLSWIMANDKLYATNYLLSNEFVQLKMPDLISKIKSYS